MIWVYQCRKCKQVVREVDPTLSNTPRATQGICLPCAKELILAGHYTPAPRGGPQTGRRESYALSTVEAFV